MMWSCLPTDSRLPCVSTYTARRRIARQRIYENELSQNRRDALHAIFLMRMMRIMRRMRNLADVQLREQHEHERLNERHEQTQRHQQHRHRKISVRRRQVRDRVEHLLVRKDVGEKTNAQRERPDEIADYLDYENQGRNPPDWSGEVPEVAQYSVLFDADVLVVKERGQT